MNFELLSLFLHPVIIVDLHGRILFSNDASEETFGFSARQFKSKTFPDSFQFEPPFEKPLVSISERTPYESAAFDSGKKSGHVQFAFEPVVDATGTQCLMVSFYDSTIETRLAKKYQGARQRTATLEEEVLNQRADLLIANMQLQRKITQTEFLLKFYARTRFVLESDAIARQFLQMACVDLGFRHGFFFPYFETVKAWRLGTYYYPEILQEHGTRLQNEAGRDLSAENFLKIPDTVGTLTTEMLADANLTGLYRALGVDKVVNGVVMSIRKENVPIGEFHFLNYVHNQRIGESALEMLRYMENPVILTFENADLHRTSITDELTQINNVRYFRLRLQSELMAATRDKKKLALLMLDIDHFKSINDRYGHPVGDSAIRSMANALKMAVRGGDVVARYGGEEMAAILPGASPATAMVVAERLRKHIAEIEVASDQGPVRFTTSVGVSLFPTHGRNMEDLIDCADKALYRAKHGGRNRVELY